MSPKVDAFIVKLDKWQAELSLLRSVILDMGLEEDLKWGSPCYSLEKSNLVILQGFKEYFAILFFKGVLLKDSAKVFSKPGENTQSSRQIRFTHLDDIISQEALIKAYVKEAIEVEKSGAKVTLKKIEEYAVPEEFQRALEEDEALKTAFARLTPGRQRMYLTHFAEAKQEATRIARIEKNKNRILIGKGLGDCICGLSQKMPTCDGSHKHAR
ncbi:DUF1801 domain-containing protein [Aquirufa aurantiipilula]|uniref:YdeI/OmpD-associated family protein n=1 Tax=Aquirufa aurantiipilula TaxID=2696561 RepID=A0ABT6BK88_9BACT|nr:DUF1801 domain-containing protein [Aquirufa aurantiipilula]MDF5690359.1 YdeI/OmpD-associated family protein [Aquirufa aurantiipilula]